MVDFENGHRFELMVSTALIGKAPKDFNWAAYYRTFHRALFTPRDLAIHIWRGHAFTPYWKTARREENFISASHMAFDFDAGDESSSLDYLMRNGSFAWMFASFAYSTPSSSPAAPRSRVVYVLEFPILTANEYRAVYRALAWWMAGDGSQTDPACKDPLRLYYGSPKCDVRANWSVLGKAAIDYVMTEYEAAHPRAVEEPRAVSLAAPVTPSAGMQNGKLKQLGEKVRFAPLNEGHSTLLRMARLAGGYVATNSLDEGDVTAELTAAAMARPEPDAVEIGRTIRDGLTNGKAAPVHFTQAPDLMRVLR